MFTGIVETIGEVLSVDPQGSLARIVVESGPIAAGVSVGDSVAVSGACLTVTRVDGTRLHFDAVAETLAKTSLRSVAPGFRVNLERAVPAAGRLDGHIVQGHVDGVGRVRALERAGDDVRLYVACGPEVARYLVVKGAVAIDGVSLTVVGAGDDGFDVALIPLTLEKTTLGSLREGDLVNLEADVLGKYVKQYLERTESGR